jgi:hypothetical protein
MKITITKKDVDEAGNFRDIFNCALAKVMQRELKDPNISTGITSVSTLGKENMLGTITPSFEESDYNKLVNGEIKEFITEYTPY